MSELDMSNERREDKEDKEEQESNDDNEDKEDKEEQESNEDNEDNDDNEKNENNGDKDQKEDNEANEEKEDNENTKQQEEHETQKREGKVFCVGCSKTGTTSLGCALNNLGYQVGNQIEAEYLLNEWITRDFGPIISFCQTADAFQDMPFSLEFTYAIMDQAFPESKFILTIRNSDEEWYQSLVRFHSKILKVKRVPTAEDLENFPYHYKGWLWDVQQCIFGVDETNVYDPKIYKEHYNRHNSEVRKYFRFRPKDLLVLNLSDPNSMKSLCDFLEIKYTGQKMPHLNKSTR